ncbi:MAG: class I SAM-dependent methyltransferase [Planctomycetota bacterium]
MPKTWEELDWYDAPRWYDAIFDVGTAQEADFLEAAFERHATCRPRGRRRALEPACGSGRLVVELARRGWRVTGFDASAPMLDFAAGRLEEAGLEAKLAEARMEDFALGRGLHLAHCLVSTFKYLLTEDDARSHLECVAESLVPGGVYVLGFHLTDYHETAVDRERWTARSGAADVVCTIQGWPADRRKRCERVRSRLRVAEAGVERRFETEWAFRTYDAAQVRRLLRSVPALEHVATYDFTHDIEAPRQLDDEQLDTVVLLRRV